MSKFTFIVISDTQIPRALNSEGEECAYCDRPQSLRKNQEHVESMNKIISEKNAQFVILNGDITEFGHDQELKDFYSIYNSLRAPIYLGLGNHDYENNVGGSFNNHCASRMVEYVYEHLKKLGISPDYKRKPFPSISYEGSLAYWWNKDGVVFIQLHNYPAYEKKIARSALPDHNITSSLFLLNMMLQMLKGQGHPPVIVNLHNSTDGWNTTEFSRILNDYGVAAVFAGHIHKNHGKLESYGAVPVFYSGSAIYHTYLVATAHYEENKLTVGRYSSVGGNAQFLGNDSVPLRWRTLSEASDNSLTLSNTEQAPPPIFSHDSLPPENFPPLLDPASLTSEENTACESGDKPDVKRETVTPISFFKSQESVPSSNQNVSENSTDRERSYSSTP